MAVSFSSRRLHRNVLEAHLTVGDEAPPLTREGVTSSRTSPVARTKALESPIEATSDVGTATARIIAVSSPPPRLDVGEPFEIVLSRT
jgi:hypothetical protein